MFHMEGMEAVTGEGGRQNGQKKEMEKVGNVKKGNKRQTFWYIGNIMAF